MSNGARDEWNDNDEWINDKGKLAPSSSSGSVASGSFDPNAIPKTQAPNNTMDKRQGPQNEA
jgi:hypothetical protein